MSQLIELKVPDIGDFAEVPVIEVFIKPGDVVKVDDALVTLESDKATMDVPASAAGVVKEVLVKLGDKIGEGAVVARIEATDSAGVTANSSAPAPSPATTPAPVAAPAPSPAAAPTPATSYTGSVDVDCDLLVLGGGPGGYSAAFRAADLGLNTVIVERYGTLGGVCLNVGCIPSKALLHIAGVMEEVTHLHELGIVELTSAKVSVEKLRDHKTKVVTKLTGGLAGMAKGRKVTQVRGLGTFIDAQHLNVEVTSGDGQKTTGEKKVVRFKQAIIAAGSQAIKLPFMPADPRVVDSTGALELKDVPKRMLVVGGGIIGLEMATVYATLGTQIDVVELGPGLMPGADRDLVKVWEKMNLSRFNRVMLNTKCIAANADNAGVSVQFEGANGAETPAAGSYDRVLVAVGRSPNGNKVGADKAGVIVDERGFIKVDNQMRTNVPNIFAIGDLVGQPMLAHKAVHEGHVAAEVAAGHKRVFDPLQIPSVAYTDPEVAWAGLTEEQCKASGRKFTKAMFPWAASGRAIANGRDEGFTKLLFDADTHRIIGGGIVGTNAGDLIGEVCLAIEMGCDAADMGHTIHPHPTLCESIGLAAEVAEGACTDLPPQKKK
ncbi:dihydrolipoyl dehydrogenase [Fluviibacter phosphoraccumulans]|uniref:Dihydrolipoyl dehydrogenase n=1 Tax=Fluviibacter phosphoraccumulans TaxID=1751046 RepID=A0A679I7G0_9RHOO|nr:dihydrolipoyl dehydrogenase [Fluviibacter phosphoraccumulans]BBU67770.1 dihydrolipoyl dehydrogenase [Fluviibacter phosphoraccumulans]BBU70691.1 dihydrolipoyl dehydrogenase [Fluviibacter phosphoraccumulans]BCA65954.1 dihydrolipoyl dehydrogenase [Fluviibacter phosphoraccumulans]